MRNIKFRGQRIDNNEWVYGYYRKKIFYNKLGDEPKEIYTKHFIGSFDNINLFNGIFEQVEVKPETICQLVAVRNGIEFYEHDIIEDFLSIRWNEEDSAFEFYWTYSGENTEGDLNWYENDSVLKEVVGNIFDNPEMVDNTVS